MISKHDKNVYFDLRKKTCSENIDILFPEWEYENEKVAVFGAHDDDPLIGAGYAMAAAMNEGAEVFVVIFCKGDCGYSYPEQKKTIVEIRKRENLAALETFGISAQNIVRFEYPDFSASHYIGYHLNNGGTGSFPEIISFIRKNKITRVLIPNGYREHADHTAVFNMTAYDIIQAGDPVVSEMGSIQKVKSFLQYSVWADFSPEDMLLSDDINPIRANRAILCPRSAEDKVRKAVGMYKSQSMIIETLLKSREERSINSGFLEVYIDYNPRPRLDYRQYSTIINNIQNTFNKNFFEE